jgi:hypothetical protein
VKDGEDPVSVVKLRTPEDILGVVPHRLGFHPVESLVVFCLAGPRRRDRLAMRMDLEDQAKDAAVAADVALRAGHVRATAAILVVYTEEPDDQDGRPARAQLVDVLVDTLRAEGVDVVEAMLVRSRQWWSYHCSDGECCPAGPSPLPEVPTPAALRYAAESVVRGDVVLSDRDVLVRSVEPSMHAVAVAVRAQAAEHADEVVEAALRSGGLPAVRSLTLARFSRLQWLYERGERALPADDVAVVLLGLRDKQARDSVMTAVVDDEPDTMLGLLALLGELARQADDIDAAPVCAALGWVAHACGRGALALVAVQRALRVEPGYELARLLLDGIDRMVPPSALREVAALVRADLTADPEEEDDEERAG